MKKQLLRTLTASILLMSTSVLAQEAPSRTECIAPAKPGGGFDLTCKLIQVSLLETGAIEKPMRVTYMPGGVGAVAYNAIVAQRPGEPGTVVAFSGGSLLNLSQGKFGRYGVDDVRWLASVGTDYGMIAVRADSPWKTLKDLMTAMEKDPNSVVIGAGASIGSQDWMKSALLAQKANVDPHKMRYVAFEGGGDHDGAGRLPNGAARERRRSAVDFRSQLIFRFINRYRRHHSVRPFTGAMVAGLWSCGIFRLNGFCHRLSWQHDGAKPA